MINSDDSALTETEVHYLWSQHVNDEFKILVGHCGSLDAAAPPPVLFVSDAAYTFGTAVEITRLLALGGHLPPLLVVGIGYRVATLKETLRLRSRDFTPTFWTPGESGEQGATGGASRFLAFIRDELKPWVKAQYGVDPEDSMYFGDSYGGLFGAHVLFSEPSTFRRYGLGSPSFYWDKKVMFTQEAEYAFDHDDLPAKVFFSVGAYENPAGERRFRNWLPADRKGEANDEDDLTDMVADSKQMVALLRGREYPSLEIEFEVLPGEYHLTAPPLVLSHSLRYLFDAPH